MNIPTRLKESDGSAKPLPPETRAALSCPECGALMERSRIGWGCPKVLGHTKILFDPTALALVESKLPASIPYFERKKEACRRLSFARQLIRWRMRNGIPQEGA